MLEHEKAAKEQHPNAKEFQPVRTSLLSGQRLLGWTFLLEEPGTNFPRVGWVTSGGEVSSDRLRSRTEAARILRAYMKSRPLAARRTVNASGAGAMAAGRDIVGHSTGDVTARNEIIKED